MRGLSAAFVWCLLPLVLSHGSHGGHSRLRKKPTGCTHDEVYNSLSDQSVRVARQTYDAHPWEGQPETFNHDDPLEVHAQSSANSSSAGGRRLEEWNYDQIGWKPIRIRAYYQESLCVASPEQIKFLKQDLVPAALKYWNDALSVRQVGGNLKVPRKCTATWRDGSCAGMDSGPQKCGSSSDPYSPQIPAAHLGGLRYCENSPTKGCVDAKDGGGVPDADYVLYVTAFQTPHCGKENGETQTLAYAGKCLKDQYDRPIAGAANFCPGKLIASTEEWEGQLSTAVHEIGHALGMSSDNYANFRFKNGAPRSPRAAGNRPITSQFDCPGSAGMSTQAVPAENTLKFFTERGVRVAKIVTPMVREVVRKHFGCNTLEGAELENQQTSAGACWGSHWEERLFETDLMSPVASHFTVYSNLTLALFEDSGWYKADYKYSQTALWGHNGGCKFAKGKCVENGVVSGPEFCTTPQKKGCTKDRLFCGYCGVTDWPDALDPAYQYFGNSNQGGMLRQVDFCPYWQVWSNTDCRVPADGPTDAKQNFYGEHYGPKARCVESSLSQAIGYYQMPGDKGKETACYDIECDKSNPSALTIKVMAYNSKNDLFMPQRVTCTAAGQEKSIPGFKGSLICPDPIELCMMRECKNECSGRGQCVGGECICAAGWGGVDCSDQECANDCSGHGTCDAHAMICLCDSGWKGNDCSVIQIAPTPPPAPVNCVMGNWSKWPPLSGCEGQFQRRKRSIQTPAAFGGKECVGALGDIRECGEHCNTTAWTEYADCDKNTGTMSRTRERDPADKGDKPCFFMKDTANCTVSCQVGEWDAWEGCTLPTDEIKTRTRSIVIQPRNGGASCPNLRDRANCPHECPAGTGTVWNRCGSACVATCDDPKPVCTGECVAKCECPHSAPYWQEGTASSGGMMGGDGSGGGMMGGMFGGGGSGGPGGMGGMPGGGGGPGAMPGPGDGPSGPPPGGEHGPPPGGKHSVGPPGGGSMGHRARRLLYALDDAITVASRRLNGIMPGGIDTGGMPAGAPYQPDENGDVGIPKGGSIPPENHPGAAAPPGTPPATPHAPGDIPKGAPGLQTGGDKVDPGAERGGGDGGVSAHGAGMAPPPTLDDGRKLPGMCVAKPKCPSTPAYLQLTVTLVGMTYKEFNHKRREAFRGAIAAEAKVKVDQVKLNKVKMMLERRRLSGRSVSASRRLSGDMEPEAAAPTGLRVSVTLTVDQVDSVEKDQMIKTAIASGALASALQDGPEGAAFASVDILYVGSEIMQTPPAAFTIEDAQELAIIVGTPLVNPIAIGVGIFVGFLCVIVTMFSCANRGFDTKLSDLRQHRLNSSGYNRDELERAGLMGGGNDNDFKMALRMQEEERRRAQGGR